MTRARIITNEGAREVSGAEFFAHIFGHAPRTKAERLAEWQAKVERYADQIERGCELSSYGNPAVADAYLLVAGRKRVLAEVQQPEARAA